MRRKFGRVKKKTKKKKGVREACFILNDFDSTKKGLPIFKESAKLDYQNTAVNRRSITVHEISPHSSFHHGNEWEEINPDNNQHNNLLHTEMKSFE